MTTTVDELEKLADRIAADLFTDGSGVTADRLVMVIEPPSGAQVQRGGWSRRPARDRILAELKRHHGLA